MDLGFGLMVDANSPATSNRRISQWTGHFSTGASWGCCCRRLLLSSGRFFIPLVIFRVLTCFRLTQVSAGDSALPTVVLSRRRCHPAWSWSLKILRNVRGPAVSSTVSGVPSAESLSFIIEIQLFTLWQFEYLTFNRHTLFQLPSGRKYWNLSRTSWQPFENKWDWIYYLSGIYILRFP